jgi:hypothetical protein
LQVVIATVVMMQGRPSVAFLLHLRNVSRFVALAEEVDLRHPSSFMSILTPQWLMMHDGRCSQQRVALDVLDEADAANKPARLVTCDASRSRRCVISEG